MFAMTIEDALLGQFRVLLKIMSDNRFIEYQITSQIHFQKFDQTKVREENCIFSQNENIDLKNLRRKQMSMYEIFRIKVVSICMCKYNF